MKLDEDIRPVTYLKSRAADLLSQINETKRPVVITQNGTPRAVLQDPESYSRMRDAIGLLKLIAMGEEDVRAGRVRDQRAVFREMRERVAKRKTGHGL